MNSGKEDSGTFDDPALKAAVRRVWGEEAAPPLLRQSLADSLAAAPASPKHRRRPFLGLAAAALVALAIGVGAYVGLRPAPPAAVSSLPPTLVDELIRTHDYCCSQPDHHMRGLPHDDMAAISRTLSGRLQLPVLAAWPGPDGWAFGGASLCPVGPMQSAHLVFRRGADDVSIFTLPAVVAWPHSPDPGESDAVAASHPVAVFVRGKGLYAIVGSSPDGSLTVDQLRTMRDRLRPELARQHEGGERLAALPEGSRSPWLAVGPQAHLFAPRAEEVGLRPDR